MNANHPDDEFRKALAADAGLAYKPPVVKMSEKELSARVRVMVEDRRLYGFTSYDFRHRHGPGFPDWIIGGPRGVIFRELKSHDGRLSPEQRAWLNLLKFHGLDAAVWTPAELEDGTVARQLDAVLGEGWGDG